MSFTLWTSDLGDISGCAFVEICRRGALEKSRSARRSVSAQAKVSKLQSFSASECKSVNSSGVSHGTVPGVAGLGLGSAFIATTRSIRADQLSIWLFADLSATPASGLFLSEKFQTTICS